MQLYSGRDFPSMFATNIKCVLVYLVHAVHFACCSLACPPPFSRKVNEVQESKNTHNRKGLIRPGYVQSASIFLRNISI